MERREMSVDAAAELLRDRVQGEAWCNKVDVGSHEDRPAIFLHVNDTPGVTSLAPGRLDLGRVGDWEGFPVMVKKTISAPSERR